MQGRVLLGMSDPTQWIVYGMSSLVLVYFVLRPMLKKKRPDPLEQMPKFGLSQQRAVERDMQHVLVELSDMARQITGQLDTRSAKLEALIDEADRRIEELKRLEGSVQSLQSPVCSRQPEADSGPGTQDSELSEDPRYLEVYNLADAGRSAQEIAGVLGKPRGEVELILALRGK